MIKIKSGKYDNKKNLTVEQIEQGNIAAANKTAAYMLVVYFLAALINLILTLIDDMNLINPMVAVSLVIANTVLAVGNKLIIKKIGLAHPTVKYMVLISTLVMQCLFTMFVDCDAVILGCAIIILTCRYYDAKFCIVIGVLVCIVQVGARLGFEYFTYMNLSKVYLLPGVTSIQIKESGSLYNSILKEQIDIRRTLETSAYYALESYVLYFGVAIFCSRLVAKAGKEMMLLREKTAFENATVEKEMSLATDIQMDALPKALPAFPHHTDITLEKLITTAKEVGGDFYDYFEIDSDKVCFVMADVSGKGVPASLFMMNAKTVIKTISETTESTAEICNKANLALSENNSAFMFVTVWIGIFNTKSRELHFTNAAHCSPILVREGEETRLLTDVHGTVMGVNGGEYYGQSTMEIKNGDRLFLYTDGLSEAHDISDGLFGEDRIIKVLDENKEKNATETMEQMQDSVTHFADGREQFDDITMMLIDFNFTEDAEVFDTEDFLDML